jgi:predicted nucleic acid-binding protein
MLLDSSYLIDLEEEVTERKFGPALAFANAHRRAAPRISIITLGELAAGSSKETGVRKFLSRYRVISLKPEIAYLAGRLERALSAKGQRLGENDNWIAATALYYGEPIVTNDNDFSRVTKVGLPLKILRY